MVNSFVLRTGVSTPGLPLINILYFVYGFQRP